MRVAEMTQEDWNLVYSKAYEKLEKLLKEGKTVVLDLANLKKSERDTARDIANKFNVSYKLIYVNTSLNEVTKRWKSNQKKLDGRKMDKSVFERGQKMFEEISLDENPVLFNSKMNFEEWIKENI